MTMRNVSRIVAVLALGLPIVGSRSALAQGKEKDVPKARVDAPVATKSESLEAIDRDFAKGLDDLERKRLGRLDRLAQAQGKVEAEKTYEAYFRLAISNGLYDEAEPVAERVLKARPVPPRLAAMAEVVNVVAEANRGDFDDSIKSLVAAVRDVDSAKAQEKPNPDAPDGPLSVGTRLTILEAYFQKLIQADQYAIARKALRLVDEHSAEEAVKHYVAARLRRLDLVGKPSPPVVGVDLDDKPFLLADLKGHPVLVVFWASWCLPCGEEVARIERVYDAHREAGFRVVGINLDALQDGGGGVVPSTAMPNVRRFLLDHNVRWPNLINGAGEHDYAKAFGVEEIPANVLIGRDGKVAHLDLVRGNVERAVSAAVTEGR